MINVVYDNSDSWILKRLAEYLADHIPGARRVNLDDRDKIFAADVALNYYVNDFTMRACGRNPKAKTVVFLDHPKGDKYLRKSDAIICMAPQYERWARATFRAPVYLAIQPTDTDVFTPRLRLGFAGRFRGQVDYSGRKGKDLLDRIEKELPWVEIVCTLGALSEEEMPAFYRSMDAVIVTSNMEGGPMCLTEALACGKPVIMPRTVGIGELFPEHLIYYKQGDFDALRSVLERLYQPMRERAQSVARYTWDNWAKEHAMIFGDILGRGGAKKPMSTCLYTTAIGAYGEELGAISIPLMQRFAHAHGWDFHGFTEQGGHKTPSWVRLDIGQHMRANGYARGIYLDLDAIIDPSAPDPFAALPADGWDVAAWDHGDADDWDCEIARRNIRDYCRDAGLPAPVGYDGRNYFNAGVMLLRGKYPDWQPGWRESRKGCQDQNALNLAVLRGDLRYQPLPRKWNNCHVREIPPDIFATSHVVHCNQPDLAPCQLHSRRTDLMRAAARLLERPGVQTAPMGYTVNFIPSATQPWIIERMQQHIIAGAPSHVETRSTRCQVDGPGVINYGLYRQFQRKSAHAKDVIFFSHPGDIDQWNKAARWCDHAIVMCERYRRDLIDKQGLPPEKVTLIYPGVDARYRQPRLRVFNPSRMEVYRDRRKGPDTWRMLESLPWLECICSRGNMSEDEVLRQYERADVVVSTATVEGGPMALLEGLAMGMAVVARKGVGLADDFPQVIRYDDDAHLVRILEMLAKIKASMSSVPPNTWEDYAAQHWGVFSRVIGVAEETTAKETTAPVTRAVRLCAPPERYAQARDYISTKGYTVVEAATSEEADVNLLGFMSHSCFAANREIKKQLERMRK